ncbi:winged helix-turn-helix transcriptional regulator [Candidatus Nanohalobium constans]|uniref:HxlR family transcriptional regulator n=1 Tax=Candidatus Nanohalobium constans TaxID=2565781 RepID=A0A5Q0UGY9_9ARCH|nr:winged helix-turn-helix transcriptional regulator [Candidatus Nanohalobium constans]QGA80854.1 HxlR family transcriptional regulator [Candidatus Nanohalobium constans]
MDERDLSPELGDLEDATEFLSRKWYPLIIFTLSEAGDLGFNDLKESIGDVSGKVLSENLSNLVEEGFVEKEVLSESPKRVKYSLTEKGTGLRPILEEMLEWAGSGEVKVLVVEDEESLADLYVNWLSSKYDVLKAVSGNEALEKIGRDVDLVVLDRELPDSSGEQISSKISEVYDCSIMFTTAHDPEVDIVDMPVDEYLTKPVSKDELLNAVSEIVDGDMTDLERNLRSLKAKKDVLESEKDLSNLEDKEKYQDLLDRIEELNRKV